MLQLKPQQSLNPAYRKVKPNRSSVSNFTKAFQQCLESIRLSDSHNESEEHIKLHLSSFFKDTFYQDYYININADTSALEAQIDVLVYQLYGLSYEEVLVVDEGFGMSEEEYLNFEIIK